MKHEKERNYIIELIKAALSNTTPSTPSEDLDWDVVFKYAEKHRIIPLLYFSIQKLPEDNKSKINNINLYELAYKANLVDDANRENEIAIVTKELFDNNVDFILLKGTVTKHFYPDTSMRMMSDVDILYKNKSAKEIKDILESKAYTQTKSTPKDAMYLSSNQRVKIEMQESLIDDGFTDWKKYLDTIWDRCTLTNNTEYAMTNEDFYIYHIVHMAKHFINGGVGLRHIVDTWVINNQFTELDTNYVDKVLKELSLDKFDQLIALLCNYWFNNYDPTNEEKEAISLLSEYIFTNGAFGNIAQQSVNESATGVKGKVFPSKETMANYYGDIIIKHPITIPFYWIRLTLTRIFSGKTRNKLKTISNMSETHQTKTKELFDICGLK